ncbi:MAG: hypothetical protein KIH08_09025 [Candidatus Freyarchaeota archaeon]|nr:hypothetical protein [Candidatus Jordarchaeia archaeon]MBS7269362.1 hypothetical protein [Candidatus Jordarchaeia archaeon]MBS7280166.1 hypothetical protein [Candidatus Jordarchaeia archaeon]
MVQDELSPGAESELYELVIPGQLVGKVVVDSAARMVGIIRSIRLSLPPLRVELIIKGLEVEFPVDVSNVLAVGSVVQLKNVAREAETVELRDVQRLRKELIEEIRQIIGKSP